MDLSISRNDLSRLLGRAASIAAAKSPTTALTCVLLDAADGRLTVRATNLLLGIESHAMAAVKTVGVVAVDARRAAEIAKNMPAGEVRLRIVKEQLELSNGKAKFKLGTVAVDQFPALPDSRDASARPVAQLEAKALARLLAAGSYAMANDEARPEQSAAFLETTSESASVLSTDRLRMASASSDTVATPAQLLIPIRAAQEVRKLADALKDELVTVTRLGSNAFFAASDQVLVVKLGEEATFPPVRKILFGDSSNGELSRVKHWVTLPREQLLDAIKRVALVSNKRGDASSLMFGFGDGQLRLSGAEAADEGEDFVPCDSTVEMEIELPPDFMSEAIGAVIDDEVRIGVSGELAPVVVTGTQSQDAIGLVMSIRKQGK